MMHININDTALLNLALQQSRINLQTETIEQREIDGEISQLHERINSLKTKRNAYARISRLPPELISEIFILAKWASKRDRAPYMDYPSDAFSRERNWLNIAGVCTHWRDIALNCPRLWSTITLTPMDRALAMISRSKSAPLFVNSSPFLTSQNLDKVASIVMSNIHRIQELDIGTRDDQKLFEFLRMNEGESASILRVLTLRGPMNPLPKDILMREMGSLQELQILKGTLASPFPSFPRLKRLHIDPTDSLTTPLLSIDVLLASLRNAPNIEELHCRQVHVPDNPPLNTPLDVVHLPRLTRLDISGLTIASSKILRLLILPQTTNITYHCQQSIPQGSNMSSLQYALLRFISVPGRVIRDISVKNQLFMLHITLDTVLRSATHTFELRLPGLANVPSDELIQLLAAVPFSKAPSLNLTGADNGIKLSPLLKLCDEVKVLTLTGCTAAAFRRLRKKADDSQVPLPKLRRLVVESCAFHISYEEQDAAMCKAMSAFLKQRKQMSMGIKELIIQDCDIIEEVVDGFRKYVKVDWDYNEIEEEEEEEDYSEDNYSDYPYSMYYG